MRNKRALFLCLSIIKLLKKHITKDYKKAKDSFAENTTKVDKEIAESLDLDDRIYCTSKREAYITMKDHKPTFANKPTCRLINPTKTELGKISKKKISKIILDVKNKTKFNQWKNSDSVIDWFSDLTNKNSLSFIQFDICEFYPSISQKLLKNALNFAALHSDISEDDKKLFFHCRKSYLFSKDKIWVKRGNPNFDVTMGSYDGAEICDIVGLYLLSQLQKLNINVGLYRDDGLAVGPQPPRELNKIKDRICQVFKENNLSITIKANQKVVEFLDVTLDLNTGLYKPFLKPNDVPIYVNKNSNHPPKILKNIPAAVNRRLSNISANENVFKEAIPPYQNALKSAGYDFEMKYEPREARNTNKSNGKRQILYFTPPYSVNCKTKVGATFLRLVDTCFPSFHPLHKIFNRNTLKIGYSCMPNMAQEISKHNSNVKNQNKEKPPPGCNCLDGQDHCPLGGACQTDELVYGAKVTKLSDQSTEFYTGLTSRAFKRRYYEHQSSFRHSEQRHKTTLSNHIWKLIDEGEDYTLKWWVIDRGKPFNPISKSCELCLKEKFHIMFSKESATLNSRREIFSTCRHRTKKLLCNF